jgi:hypothetical protein
VYQGIWAINHPAIAFDSSARYREPNDPRSIFLLNSPITWLVIIRKCLILKDITVYLHERVVN